MTATADVIIVNWNSGALLKECIGSLERSDGSVLGCVIVVDNASSDGSDEVQSSSLRLVLERLDQNYGFAKACNIGAALAASPYLLFPNPDVRVETDTIAKAVAFLESPKSARFGICGVRLVGEGGDVQRHCHEFPTWRAFLGRSLGRSWLTSGIFPPFGMPHFAHDYSREVDHVIGAFYLIRRNLFAELQGFDERFFVYYEDLDLSLRARQLGRPAYYLNEAEAFHEGGGSSSQVKGKRLFYDLRGRIFYGFKHYSRGQAVLLLLTILVVDPAARLVRTLVGGYASELKGIVEGYILLWKALPAILKVGLSGSTHN